MNASIRRPDVAVARSAAPPSDEGLNARQPGAIRHALQILECVARHGPGTTATEISTELGISRAATYRLVRLLADDGYLVRMPDLRGFALGQRVAELAAPAAATTLSRAARAVLTVVRGRVRAGVHLVHYVGDRIVLTDEDGDLPMADAHRMSTDPDWTAAGRLAAAWSEAIRVGRDPPPFAVEIGPGGSDRGCLALPVPDDTGRLVAALVVEAAATRLREPEELVALLRGGIAELTMLLT